MKKNATSCSTQLSFNPTSQLSETGRAPGPDSPPAMTQLIEDIVFGYKQLYDVEHAFRSLKTTLKLRPNYHSKDERIRCHIFLCFLSLLLIRIVENQTGKTWCSVRDEMSRLYFGEFDHSGSSVRLLTELTKEQRTILQAMNIRTIHSGRHTPIINL